MNLRWVAILILCLGTLFLGAATSCGQEIELDNLVVDNQSGDIRVRFGLRLNGVEEVRRILGEGSPLGLECTAIMYRKRDTLWDESIAQSSFVQEIKFNPLTKEYQLRPGPQSDVLQGTELAELLDTAWDRLTIDLGPWTRLKPGHVYALELSVSIRRQEVPDWVRATLFFRSWEAVPESVYRLEFSY